MTRLPRPETEREFLEILDKHLIDLIDKYGYECRCGTVGSAEPRKNSQAKHREHLAEALADNDWEAIASISVHSHLGRQRLLIDALRRSITEAARVHEPVDMEPGVSECAECETEWPCRTITYLNISRLLDPETSKYFEGLPDLT